MGTLRDLITDDEHRALLDWWFDARGQRAMPMRADFDPLDHPRFLPRIFLVEVAIDPPQFINRLCGTEIDEQQGYPMTGRPFEDTFAGELLSFTVARFTEVAFKRCLSYYSTIFTKDDPPRRTRFTRLLLPLSLGGSRVDMILGSRIQDGDLSCSYQALLDDGSARHRHEIAVADAATADRAEVIVPQA